jgi:hypothetical protein
MLTTGLLLSGTGVAVAAMAFYNRDKPAWQKECERSTSSPSGRWF